MQGRLNAGHDSLVDSVQERVGPDRYRTVNAGSPEVRGVAGRDNGHASGPDLLRDVSIHIHITSEFCCVRESVK